MTYHHQVHIPSSGTYNNIPSSDTHNNIPSSDTHNNIPSSDTHNNIPSSGGVSSGASLVKSGSKFATSVALFTSGLKGVGIYI